jgi:hypothetical protein
MIVVVRTGIHKADSQIEILGMKIEPRRKIIKRSQIVESQFESEIAELGRIFIE